MRLHQCPAFWASRQRRDRNFPILSPSLVSLAFRYLPLWADSSHPSHLLHNKSNVDIILAVGWLVKFYLDEVLAGRSFPLRHDFNPPISLVI